MARNKVKVLVGDFETTVYEGQQKTEVWASALVELYTEDVMIFHSIDETFDFLQSLDENLIVYYHNLKFDGSFWIDYLLRVKHFKQAYTQEGDNWRTIEWLKPSDMPNKSISYVISETGMFYLLTIRVNNHYIEIRDSLKLLPFSVSTIGKSFGTKHKKLDMEYEGYRYAGCEITPEEKKYIANDVLVVKEALETMYSQGNSKLTIGACCLSEFKKGYPNEYPETAFRTFFPDLSKYKLDPELYGADNADAYIRKSYRGGWCYVNPKYQKKELGKGFTLDVNSLYPSMMHSSSGNVFPIGKPTFWKGERPPLTYNIGRYENYYFFIRIKTKFKIKKGYLPFIQVKNSFMYKRNASLTTSNYIDPQGIEHEYFTKDGKIIPCMLTLTLTMTDYYLFREHYDVEYIEVLDGCYFKTMTCAELFDSYIEKYKKIKQASTGALRTLAKLFLNNLYGKLATSSNSSFKVAYIDEKQNIVKFFTVPRSDKEVIYIPIGSAITSYARNFTIRAAQKNYRIFVYADTDSIHCVGDISDVKGVTIDDTEFCCWKHESTWDLGYFTRQKTYIERVVENGDAHYDIKCAGMPERCKKLFIASLTGVPPDDFDKLSDEKKEFVLQKRELTDFDIGLKIPGKLIPKRIEGGILLDEEEYTMRE